MLGRLRQAVWVALFAWLLAAYGYMGWVASSQKHPAQHYATKNANYEKANGDKQKSWMQRATGDPLAVFTLFLVVVGGTQVGLFLWQLRLIRESLRDAKVAADAAKDGAEAAKKSAEALPAIERAYVFVNVSLYQAILVTQDGAAASPVIVVFRNYGKTPAILAKLRAYCIISEKTPQELIAFPGSEHELPQGLVIAASDGFTHQVGAHVKTSELGEIETEDKRLFCVGRIEYRDVLGVTRETGFCWQYRHHMARGSFIIAPNTKLNYYT